MLTEKLLETLRSERESLDAAITIIENRLQRSAVRKKIVRAVKHGKKKRGVKNGHSYKGKHWMQLPENRERVIAMAKKRAALRKKNK